MEFIKRHARSLTVGFAIAMIFSGGIAVANWLASGTGSAYSKAGSEQALSTVSAAADVTTPLFPGQTGDVAIRVVNPNAALTLTVLDFSGATVTSDKGAACNASTGVTISQAVVNTYLGAGKPLPNGTTLFDIAGAASMSNASDTSCQGATFTISPVGLQATT